MFCDERERPRLAVGLLCRTEKEARARNIAFDASRRRRAHARTILVSRNGRSTVVLLPCRHEMSAKEVRKQDLTAALRRLGLPTDECLKYKRAAFFINGMIMLTDLSGGWTAEMVGERINQEKYLLEFTDYRTRFPSAVGPPGTTVDEERERAILEPLGGCYPPWMPWTKHILSRACRPASRAE